MEKVRTVFKAMLSLVMATILLASSVMPTFAASSNTYKPIVTNKSGTINLGQRTKRKFTLQAKSKVKISFLGLDFEKDIGTYGRYKITIKNSKGKKVYGKIGETGYDNVKHVTPELPKGDYTFILEVAEEEGYSYYPDSLDYCYSLSYMVTAKVKIKKVVVKPNSVNMKKGATKTLKATLTPSYATSAVTWSSSNKKVATVKKGKVTAKALGNAKITAKSGGKSATCKVRVNSMSTVVIKKRSKKLSNYIKNISGYKNAKWKSSNTKIATVDKNGRARGVGYGKCEIYCTIKGVKYTFKVTVKAPVSVSFAYLEDTSIYNEASLKFKNNTNHDITYITLNIYQYDNRGSRLQSPYDYYYINDTIKANTSEVYEFWVNDSTKSVKYSITKVWFSDGTTWTP